MGHRYRAVSVPDWKKLGPLMNTFYQQQGYKSDDEEEDEDKKRKGIQHSLEVEIKWFDGDDSGGPLELG